MAVKYGIILFLILIGSKAGAQHLIGLSKDEVVKRMHETSFAIDNTSRNSTFNYLKYIDREGDRTFLVFLSKDNICTTTKLMSDYSSLKSTLSEFNKKYKKIKPLEWNYNLNGVTYKVTLKKEEWFYSVIVTAKTK